MVRVNLVKPEVLADQHLIAEYNEILMLVGYVKKFPDLNGIPEEFCLGKGHIKFFKNKLGYIDGRHKEIKLEMKKRGFETNKKLDLKGFGKQYKEDWKPMKNDFEVIVERLKWKISLKPEWYRYYGENKDLDFWNGLMFSC